MEKNIKPQRDSGIELFRIITMFMIVMHHYVINSGISEAIMKGEGIMPNALFLALFGWGGKTGINCFVLITGYFMCRSRITLKKFLKLFIWIELYKVIFLLVFTLTGYRELTWEYALKMLKPVSSIGNEFISTYLLFYFFIPFLNILIAGMKKKQHLALVCLTVLIYTAAPVLKVKLVFNYISWFMIIYLIGAYIRLYPQRWFDSRRLWGLIALGMLLLSWGSVAFKFFTDRAQLYYWVSDSNKPMALLLSVSAFMFFKNLNIGYNKFINMIAASAFGVLLIHNGSDTMRWWLWVEYLKNIDYLYAGNVFVNAFATCIIIYALATAIDILRLNALEKPLFRLYDKMSR